MGSKGTNFRDVLKADENKLCVILTTGSTHRRILENVLAEKRQQNLIIEELEELNKSLSGEYFSTRL